MLKLSRVINISPEKEKTLCLDLVETVHFGT